MCLRGISVLAILAVWLLLPLSLSATEQADMAIQQLQLKLATLYERMHDWEKAEAEFLEAAKGPSEKLREQSLGGIERVRKNAENSNNSSSLKLGDFYARQKMWSEAEKYYLSAAEDGSEGVQRLALEGLKSVRDQIPRSRLAEDLKLRSDIFSGFISQGLAIVGVLIILALLVMAIRRVREIRRGIEVLPFVASSESTGAQFSYWLGHTQAIIRSASTLPRAAGAKGTFVLPYLQLPSLAEQLPELGEIDLAGVKVPVGELLRRIGRPRVRVSGGWVTDNTNGRVFAAFERRRGLSHYELYATIERDVPAKQQDQELELFAYQLLMKAVETYDS